MKLALQLNRIPKEAVVNWKQAKDFFTTTTSNFQDATQELTDTSSVAMQNAIAQARAQGFAAFINNWLQAHPVIFRVLNTLIWAIDHPVISLAVMILTITVAFSIFKGLNRLLEMVGWSLLKAPFKLIKSGLQIGQLGIQQTFTNKNTSDNDVKIITPQNSQQRLVEISQRLQILQKEQNELLQEAVTILTLNKH